MTLLSQRAPGFVLCWTSDTARAGQRVRSLHRSTRRSLSKWHWVIHRTKDLRVGLKHGQPNTASTFYSKPLKLRWGARSRRTGTASKYGQSWNRWNTTHRLVLPRKAWWRAWLCKSIEGCQTQLSVAVEEHIGVCIYIYIGMYVHIEVPWTGRCAAAGLVLGPDEQCNPLNHRDNSMHHHLAFI